MGRLSLNLMCDPGKSLNLSGLGLFVCKVKTLDSTSLTFLSVQTSRIYNFWFLMYLSHRQAGVGR